MYLKAHRRNKDGKSHVYYSLTESVRVSRSRVIQRRVLNLGELNTTQVDRWQRTIEVIEEDGRRHQMRLFTDREGGAPKAEDVAEVILSSLSLRRPRQFGACWVGCKLWEELGLRSFWEQALGECRGGVPWDRVLELLVVNRLSEPGSELGAHQRWFPKTAMDFLLDAGVSVAEKDRLYRCLDKILAHKEGLQKHLAERWRDLYGARLDVLLYDLTSTYFEGETAAAPKAQRGYSRDHRPDCKQVVLALVVTPEGFPISYEVFPGNRSDVTSLDEMLRSVEAKYGQIGRVWVFDRGVVSEENLALIRQRGGKYLVGTPRRQLKAFERELLGKGWQKAREQVEVKLRSGEDGDLYVLARSVKRRAKERAMRRRRMRGLYDSLRSLASAVRRGHVRRYEVLLRRLGRLEERYAPVFAFVELRYQPQGEHIEQFSFGLKRTALKRAYRYDGAYLLRSNLREEDPGRLWAQYIQLTEVEAVFRVLKTDLALRPIWHYTAERIEAHILVAFLGYCLWVALKHKLRASAPGLTPAQCLDQFGQILMVEVWFRLRDGRQICLPRITEPQEAQAMLLHQLGWRLPEQPPPRITAGQARSCVADR